MVDIKDDGGPAFPQHLLETRDGGFETSSDVPNGGGMTLRDYFAAKALNGFLSDAESMVALRERYGHQVAQNLAMACYQFADAMLEARKS